MTIIKPKKIILIIIGTLRADHLGCYGYKRNTSPNIDNLAKESILFKHAFSPSAHTLPSLSSIFTSKYPSNSDSDITLPLILSTIEYNTAAFISSTELRKDTKFKAGFEVYDDEMGSDPYARRNCLLTNQQVFKWLKDNSLNDFFLFIHYSDVHGPYINPEPYKNIFINDYLYGARPEYIQGTFDLYPSYKSIPCYQILNPIRDENKNLLDYEKDARYYKAQYDGCIKYFDDNIADLIEKIKKLEIYDDSLIIITSDHGEACGENNIFFYHGLTVTSDQISVPLILKPHKGWDVELGIINTPVSSIDIMPTIFSLCDYDYKDKGIEGHSLKRIIEDKKDPILQERTLISENECQYALIHPDGLMELKKKDLPASTYYPYISALIDALDRKKYYWDSGNEYDLTLPFDQYQRYKIISDIINKFRKNKNLFKILDVGASFEGNLKRFLSNDDIYFLDKEYPPEYIEKGNYIIGDITKIELKETYDFVISVDTYEHIHPIFREKFIINLLNLSKIATIIAAPFDTAGVREHEVFANEVYKHSHGIEHKWLHEHIQNGLPSLPFTLEFIKKLGFDFSVIPNGHLPRWFEMISLYLLIEGKPEFLESMEALNEFYNKNFYYYDNLNPSYRQIIIITNVDSNIDFSDIYSKNSELDDDFNIKYEMLQSFFIKIKELYSNYKYKKLIDKYAQITELTAQITKLTDALQVKDAQLKALETNFHEKKEQVAELTNSLQAIYQSITWRAVMRCQKVIERLIPPGTKRRHYYNQLLLGVIVNGNKCGPK